jgi:hypothetical protein
MSEGATILEAVRLMAERRGLAKVLKLYPHEMQAAAERGLKPLGETPKGNSPIASPAPIFNPARFEREK